jgi:hypothetical protein
MATPLRQAAYQTIGSLMIDMLGLAMRAVAHTANTDHGQGPRQRWLCQYWHQ